MYKQHEKEASGRWLRVGEKIQTILASKSQHQTPFYQGPTNKQSYSVHTLSDSALPRDFDLTGPSSHTRSQDCRLWGPRVFESQERAVTTFTYLACLGVRVRWRENLIQAD